MHIAREIDIARPVADVYAYLCDDARLMEWRHNLTAVERLTPAGGGVDGARYREVMSTPVGPQTSIVEVSSDSERHLGFKVVEGTIKPAGTMTLAPTETGTHLTYTVDCDTGFGPIGALVGTVLLQTTEKSLANLQARLEA